MSLRSSFLDAIKRHKKGMPLNDQGQLVPDPTPMAPPIGYKKTESMVEIVRRQVRLASLEAQAAGAETLEQSDDFDVGDDPELRSPYELDQEGEVPISVLRHRAETAQLDYFDAKRAAGEKMQADHKGGNPSPDNTQAAGGGGGKAGGRQKPPQPRPLGASNPLKRLLTPRQPRGVFNGGQISASSRSALF